MILEVCIDNIRSAEEAYKGGANRLEVCGDLSIGGITPELELIKSIKSKFDIPIRMMVRPRGGNFIYTSKELKKMRSTIIKAKSLKIEGVVFGLLDDKGFIDEKGTKQLVELAKPLAVTFHRAFDDCRNPIEGLHYLKKIGVDTILTSGQKPTAIEGIDLIKKLVELANNKITILAGSGINPKNISKIIKATSANAYHGSCKGNLGNTDKKTVKQLIQILQNSKEVINS